MNNEVLAPPSHIRLFRPEHVPQPRNLAPFALPTGPLDVEIGCGVGLHPLNWARQNPHRTVVALEHTHTRFGAFSQTLALDGTPPNLNAIQANAIGWITHALPLTPCVDRYFILYPNPNPKSRAGRWALMPFFGRLMTTLKPGGTITMATNLPWYADEAAEAMALAWGLTVTRRDFTAADSPVGAGRTHFERKFLEREERCFEVLGSKSISSH